MDNAGNKTEFEKLKKSLPAFTPSGTFEGGRKPELLKQYSHCIILDLDHIPAEEISRIKSAITNEPCVVATFTSPSGKGLKIIVRVDSSKDLHKVAFEQVKNHFEQKFSITVDKSGKDITRLCFVSFDPEAWCRSDAIVFQIKNPLSNTFNQPQTLPEIFNSCVRFTEQKESFHSGNRNNFVFLLANNLNRKGVSEHEALSLIQQHYNYNQSEVIATVKSAYEHCNEHGSSLPSPKWRGVGGEVSKPSTKSTSQAPSQKERAGERPHITSNKFILAQHYLKEHFNIRRNIVTMEYECRDLQKTAFENMNEFNIYVKMQMSGLNISLNNLVALLRSDFIPAYNPFQEYFVNLPPWDQKTDYISLLASFVKTNDRVRFTHHFKKWLVRVVACALVDSFFNKQAFVLVHDKQNSGKSTFCRFLCPPALSDYLAENISVDKDSRILLTRNILINLDELSTLSKVEINSLKSLFSKDKINERLPYDRRNTNLPRRCSFIGSTNQLEFLNDETGSVRWLCFMIDEIDWNYSSKVDINKVYAQAYHLFKNNFQYNLTVEEIQENEECNRQFLINTSEKELITKYLSPATKERHEAFLTATDVLLYITSMSEGRVKLSPINVGKALKLCGFERLKHGIDKIYGYYVFKK